MSEATVDEDQATQLRGKAVDELIASGDIVSKPVETVMRQVRRHAFVPEATLEAAYDAISAVVTKRNDDGGSISSVSAPQIQAMMLEQADIQPGMRVLEIGSGGLNAAYLAELVGEGGEVTTVDIDPDIVARAQRLLTANGYPQVRVVLADAAGGVPQHAPYDRILVTAGAWDIPPAWFEQLAEDGRLVVPLRIRNLTRSIGFQRNGSRLDSTSSRICGFVPMQGKEEHDGQALLVTGTEEIRLWFEDGLPENPSLLDNAVRTPRAEVWTGVTVGRTEVLDTLQMYLATALDHFCTMSVNPDLDTGLVAPSNKWFSLAAVDGPDFGYLTVRRTSDENQVEYGAHALGPSAPAFAQLLAQHVQTWAAEHRGGPGPRFTVHPAGTADDQLPKAPLRRVIDKKHCRVTLSWNTAATATGGQGILHQHTTQV
ncbi:methyltransferase, FxLD system [Streptomyces hainanensis]|uniref:Protein-L-isoaspartate O-methyltransferase n=1 Tax=Streptomyces hainanensis TaxID=402648 RepID=A0A4R4TH74_9ACTN|nr:methyltransferase, FxLD system [Streptomyces hainanensis]TDC75686.1 methyltransferase, FxLD system [Streptomyces hainanensis]